MQGNFRIFVAGGSGTIGLPLVRALVTAGHHVTAMTRSPEKQPALRALGATPVVADALDAAQLRAAVAGARPTHVIHELTAIPREGVRRASDLFMTNRLRSEGTRYLLDAAVAAGAKRFIVGSFALMQGMTGKLSPEVQAAVDAVSAMESQTLDATRSGKIDGIVLRYGLFYGPQNPATTNMITMVRRRILPVVRGDRGLLPCIHVDDAVSATLAALDHGFPGGVYDIVDDRAVSMTEIVQTLAEYAGAPPPFSVPAWVPRIMAPFLATMTAMRLPLSNAKARHELHWRPRYSTLREGLAHTVAHAA